MTKTVQKTGISKYFNKELIPFLISIVLALASVYLIGPWIDKVMTLDTMQIVFNFAAAATTLITFYVAKTHYSKGSLNVFKKIFMVILFSALTIGFAILSAPTMNDLMYPLAGIFIVSVTFYMVSLSSETLGLLGMAGLTIILGALIIGGVVYKDFSYDTAMFWSKIAFLIILSVGGVFAKARMYMHGIRGVNNDGGFGGEGDTNDGDGDTGEE